MKSLTSSSEAAGMEVLLFQDTWSRIKFGGSASSARVTHGCGSRGGYSGLSLATSRGNSQGSGTACNYGNNSRNRDVEVGGEVARDWGHAPESAAWRSPLRHRTRKGR